MKIIAGLILAFAVASSNAAEFKVSWDFLAKPALDVAVGDSIVFSWAAGNHDIYIHPTLNCDETGAIAVHTPPSGFGEVTYVVQQADAGLELFFACDVGGHCESNVNVVVNVAADTPAPTPVPATASPTAAPVAADTGSPTAAPVAADTSAPTAAPVVADTAAPTAAPVVADTAAPTAAPVATNPPTAGSVAPTTSPMPSRMPSASPTGPLTPAPTDSFPPTREGDIDYFDDPIEKWSVQLPNTGSASGPNIGKGNSVSVSPDGSLVYVTLDDGSLNVLVASSGELRWSYKPDPVGFGFQVSGRGGVVFSEIPTQGKYAIYTVLDVPVSGDMSAAKSRFIAVSHPGNELLWISDPIPGEVQGNPAITENPRLAGQCILFTHNQLNITTGELYGSFSMVLGISGELVYTETAGESEFDPNPEDLRIDTLSLPYGAVGVVHEPRYGRFPGGTGNRMDIFVWSTSVNEGRGGDGYSRAFQLPKLFQTAFVGNLNTVFLKDNRWSAIAPPALTKDGLSLYFGVSRNAVRAWTGLGDYVKNGNVAVNDFPLHPTVPNTPIPYQPVLSLSERRLFLSLSAPSLQMIDAVTGTIRWGLAGNAPVSGTVKPSPTDGVIYFAWEDGTVMAVDQRTGEPVWSFGCADLAANPATVCRDEVFAETSLSSNGMVFYYGDTTGNVKALRLGEMTFNTTAPTGFPTEAPTAVPTPVISASPSAETESPSASPTNPPSVSPMPSDEDDTLAPSVAPSNNETAQPTPDDSSSTRLMVPSLAAILAALVSAAM